MHAAGSQIAHKNPTCYYFKLPSNFSIVRLKSNIGSYRVCLHTAEEGKDSCDRYNSESYNQLGLPGGLSERPFPPGLSYGSAGVELAGNTYTSLDLHQHQHQGFADQTSSFTYSSW